MWIFSEFLRLKFRLCLTRARPLISEASLVVYQLSPLAESFPTCEAQIWLVAHVDSDVDVQSAHG